LTAAAPMSVPTVSRNSRHAVSRHFTALTALITCILPASRALIVSCRRACFQGRIQLSVVSHQSSAKGKSALVDKDAAAPWYGSIDLVLADR
jgi:hypothetical protein